MKAKFTKASSKDRFLVTVSLSQLDDLGVRIFNPYAKKWVCPTEVPLTAEFVLTLDGVRTVFVVNRENRTATTKTFPRHLRMPKVGQPRIVEINDKGYGF